MHCREADLPAFQTAGGLDRLEHHRRADSFALQGTVERQDLHLATFDVEGEQPDDFVVAPLEEPLFLVRIEGSPAAHHHPAVPMSADEVRDVVAVRVLDLLSRHTAFCTRK